MATKELWMHRGQTKYQLGIDRPGAPPFTFHSPTSIFNTRLPDNAVLVTAGGYAQKYANQCQYTPTSSPVKGYYPAPYNVAINTGSWSVPVWVIEDPNYPTTRVQWLTNSGNGPPADQNIVNGLQSHFEAVPVPQGVGSQLQAAESDRAVVFFKPRTGEVWEFWLWKGEAEAPRTYGGVSYPNSCGYGGYIPNIYESDGRIPNTWGLRSTSISALGGLMMLQEYRDGEFPHALVMSSCVSTGTFIAPATRGDSAGGFSGAANPPGDTRDAVPHGAMFRLPASTTINPAWSPMLKMIVRAVRDYGMFIVDVSGVPAWYAEDPKTVSKGFSRSTKTWSDLGINTATTSFPWNSLQQVKWPIEEA